MDLTMNDEGRSVFAKYIEGEPEKEPAEPDIVRKGPQPIIPPAHRKSSPSEKLLEWLVNYWAKPTITLRDISAYGPRCARDPKDVVSLTEILVQYGWLAPTKAWRRDMKKWRVIREPGKRVVQ
jgi:hypothetical protein